MDRPRLRRLLLALLAETPPDPAPYRALPMRAWREVDRMAGMHGLRPLLHLRNATLAQAGAIPAPIWQGWQDGRRNAAIRALVQRRDLLEIQAILTQAGLGQPVALKGAFLAWYAYDEPALRVMGDLDLLLCPEQALAAFEALKAAGYVQQKPFELSPADTVLLLKHLPPLASPQGTLVELHMRCWRDDDPLLYPESDDMLVHLVVHGAYDFRLNCGPRALLDCVAMTDRFPPEWDRFWTMGRDEGWAKGTALLFALADRWIRPGLLAQCDCPLPVTPRVLEAAPDLLLQEPGRSTAAQAPADLRRAARASRRAGDWRRTGPAAPAPGRAAYDHPVHVGSNSAKQVKHRRVVGIGRQAMRCGFDPECARQGERRAAIVDHQYVVQPPATARHDPSLDGQAHDQQQRAAKAQAQAQRGARKMRIRLEVERHEIEQRGRQQQRDHRLQPGGADIGERGEGIAAIIQRDREEQRQDQLNFQHGHPFREQPGIGISGQQKPRQQGDNIAYQHGEIEPQAAAFL